MSKSKGNAVDPFEALATYGADAIRWYFYSNSAPWLPNRFYAEAVTEGQRKFMGTLWNTYAFYVLYANIDNFNPTEYTLDYEKLGVMDRWILSRLQSTVKAVDENMQIYRIPETCRVLTDFVDELSNWYVRRSRERFWAKGMEQDKINAYMTLYTSLVTLCRAAAPMVPFMTEDIYRNLVCSVDKSAPESVHLCDFPVSEESWILPELEKEMEDVLEVVVLGRACRNQANIKNRQPVGLVYVKSDFTLPAFCCDIIRDELNVKNVQFTDNVRDFTTYTFKPQMRTLGPKYGKQLGAIRGMLGEVDGNAAMDALDADGVLKLMLPDGTVAELTKDDLLIDMAQKSGYESVSDHGITVVIDTNLTSELLEEGMVREIVSKIQTMRKDSGFEVMDHIEIAVWGNDTVAAVMKKNAADICADTLCDNIVYGEGAENAKKWNLNGESVMLGVKRL